MADQSDHMMMQQQMLLREIRDEIRISRSESSGGVAAPASGGVTGRPSSAHVRAQMATDQFLSDKWNGLGWANAYRSEIRTGFYRDAIGASGFMPAPNTMTQLEYQQFAAEGLGISIADTGNHIFGVAAPGFTAQNNALADEIFRLSPRFARAGSPSAGILGIGLNRGASREIARQIGVMTAGDMRLSQSDMQTIVSAGGRAGQFDFASSSQDFVTKLRELAEVTGELTRTTRLSVSEMSQTLGALRQFGIQDVSDQARTVRQLSATARVTGISTGDMMRLGAGAVQSGFGAGVGAVPSLGLIQQNMLLARGVGPAGLVSQNILAAGGGEAQIAQSITAAQQGFLGSQAGQFAMLGGLGRIQGDVFQAAMSGITGTQGTLSGIFGAQRQGFEMMQGLNSGRANEAYLNYVQSQLRLMGIRDMRSQTAQDAAFSMLRGSMGDSAAMVFSRSNFSVEGQMMQDRSQMRQIEESSRQQRAAAYDEYYMATDPRQFFRRTGARLQMATAQIHANVTRAFSPGQSGYSLGLGRFLGQYQRDANAISAGAAADDADSAATLIAGLNRGGSTQRELMLHSLAGPSIYASMGLGAAGSIAGGLGGMWAGAKLGGLLGTFGGPLGMLAGGAIGGAIGGAAGFAIPSLFGGATTAVLRGQDVDEYMAVANGVAGARSPSRDLARRILQGEDSGSTASAIMSDSRFIKLMQRGNRSKMSVSDSKAFVGDVTTIAANAGVDVDVVTEMLKMTGSDIGLADAMTFQGKFDNADAAIEELLSGTGLVGVDFNFATADAAGALANFLEASTTGEGSAIARSRYQLREQGLTSAAAFDQISANFQSEFDAGSRQALITSLRGRQARGGDRQINRVLDTGASFIESIIGGGQPGAQREAAMRALRATRGDRNELINIIMGQGQVEGSAALNAILRGSDSAVMQDALRLGSMDLTNMSANRIASQFEGISTDMVSQLQRQMAEQGVDESRRPEMLKRALLVQQLSDRNIKEEGFDSEDAMITQSLERTTNLLNKITSRLGSTNG